MDAVVIARRDDEAGTTLVELLVTLTILSVVLAALAGGVIAVQRASYAVDVRTDNVGRARVAVAAVSRSLRAATTPPTDSSKPPFATAAPDRAEFTAYLGDPDVPVRIVLEAVDGTLTEEVFLPTVTPTGVTYPTSRGRRVLARDLVSDEVFRYVAVDDAGTRYELGDTSSDSERRRVERVRIRLETTRGTQTRVAPQVLTTEVRLPNRGTP